MGIVNIISSQGINTIRSLSKKFAIRIGRTGYGLSVYNYAINELIKKVKEEMQKSNIDKICNVKIHVEFPTTNEIVCQFNGTALKIKETSK